MIGVRFRQTSDRLSVAQIAESQRWRFRSNFNVRVQLRKS